MKSMVIPSSSIGVTAFTSLSNFTSAMDDTMNSPVPTGGVSNPIVRLIQMMTPK